jgi:hypothetical protein
MPGSVPQKATATQLEVLAGLHQLAKKLRKPTWAVTQIELAAHLGYATAVGVIKPLRALERTGLIVPKERLVRVGFSVTPAGRAALRKRR